MLDQIHEETGSDAEEQMQPKQMQSAEIVLDPDVLAALCRRGRRRLRDIQQSSQATLKLDRFRGVLQVTGFQSAIADVLRQLESLSGPCLSVTAAVWAELMRTRKIDDMTQAAVARIQHESGCRVHIDRNSQDVRLFGRQDKVVVAQRLIEQLGPMCVAEIVHMKGPMPLDAEQLQVFAQVFGVGLQLDQRQITVLGITGAVAEAATELRKSNVGAGLDVGTPSEAARLAISEAMASLQGDGDAGNDAAYGYIQANNISMQTVSRNGMQGAGPTKFATSRAPVNMNHASRSAAAPKMRTVQEIEGTGGGGGGGACVTCGDSSNFCVHCGKPARRIMTGPNAGCTTCGAVNFCAFCGGATEKGLQARGGGSPAALPQVFYEGYNMDADSAATMQMMPMQYFQPGVNPQVMMMPGMPGMMLPMTGMPFQQAGSPMLTGPTIPVMCN